MTDILMKALEGLEAIDPKQASRLLAAFAAIGDTGGREHVIALAEALARSRASH